MSKRIGSRKLLATAVLVLGLGVGAGLASAAAVGVSIPELGINAPVPAEKAAPLQRLVSVATTDANTEPAPAPSSEPAPIPGQLLGSDVPVPVPPSVLQERNGWLVSDGETLLAVYAGASGADASVGRVVIVRQDLVDGTQTVRVVDAGPTGALAIAHAPLGSSVETSAQTGSIFLRTRSGRSVTLDLSSDHLGG
jgi:hypothetical protein